MEVTGLAKKFVCSHHVLQIELLEVFFLNLRVENLFPPRHIQLSKVWSAEVFLSPRPGPGRNLYYYAANNPSEATIAKRRGYAATISYLTPPAENAGLYKGLGELREPGCCLSRTFGVQPTTFFQP